MSRMTNTREYGISLGRLPGYVTPIHANPVLVNQAGAKALRAEMIAFVAAKAVMRIKGGKSADKTIRKAQEILSELCLRLWRLGYQVKTIDHINGRHIEAVVRDHWACGASPKHMAAIMTQLNKFDDWIKKANMVKTKEVYLPEVDAREFLVSITDNPRSSWFENDLDLAQKIKEADRMDIRFGLMLRMVVAFGLRRGEVLQIKPWRDARTDFLDIRAAVANNRRARTIPYLNTVHRAVVEYVQANVGRYETLGWIDNRFTRDVLLKRNGQRYNYLMTKLGITKAESGVTGQWLRANPAEGLAILMKTLPPESQMDEPV